KCRREVRTEAAECPNCGASLASATKDEPSAREMSGNEIRTQTDLDRSRLGDTAKPGDREMPVGAESRQPLPRAVKVLGRLYLVAGGLGLIEMIWAALQGTFYLSAGVIAIPLGAGLLCRSPAWRKLALGAAVVQILVIGLVAYLLWRPGEGFAN